MIIRSLYHEVINIMPQEKLCVLHFYERLTALTASAVLPGQIILGFRDVFLYVIVVNI